MLLWCLLHHHRRVLLGIININQGYRPFPHNSITIILNDIILVSNFTIPFMFRLEQQLIRRIHILRIIRSTRGNQVLCSASTPMLLQQVVRNTFPCAPVRRLLLRIRWYGPMLQVPMGSFIITPRRRLRYLFP